MGILSSMYTGVSGLSGQSEALSVYSDNIANAGTIGFKVSRPEFEDVISKSLKGLLGGNQIGRGVRLAAVNPIFTQGSVQQTESSTDLAITGDGFFMVEGVDGRSYTRNGSLHFDKEGKLINADNFRLLGFQADENGKISSKLGDISLNRTVLEAKRSSEVKMIMNLDLRAKSEMVFDPKNPDQTSHFSTGVTVFDSAGTAHASTVYFNKTADGVWSWKAMVRGEETTNGVKGQLLECAGGKLNFDPDGRLKNQTTEFSSFNFNNGALPNQSIKFNFGADRAHGGEGTEVTQYGGSSELLKSSQDGYSSGTVTGMSFTDDGTLNALYSNGETISIAQIALATFEDPESLFKLGQNRFRESVLSGSPNIGAPSVGGKGRISAKTLEASTTDIAAEFINLIQAQRNFQANSKVIMTADEMLQEVLALKRS